MTQAQLSQQHRSFDQQYSSRQFIEPLQRCKPSGIGKVTASIQHTGDFHYNTAMAQSMLNEYGPPIQAWNLQQAQLEGSRPQSAASNNVNSGGMQYPHLKAWKNSGFGSSQKWDRDQDRLQRSPYIMSDPGSASQFHQNQELMYNHMAAQNVAVKGFGSWVPTTPNGLPSGLDINAVTSDSPTSYLSDDFENTYSPGSLPDQNSPVTNWQGFPQSVQNGSHYALKTESPITDGFNGYTIPMTRVSTQYQHGPQSSSAYTFAQDSTSGYAPWSQPNYPNELSMPTSGARNADSYNIHSSSNTSASAQDDQIAQSHQATSFMNLLPQNQHQIYSQVPFSAAGVQATSYTTLPSQKHSEVQSQVPPNAASLQATSRATLFTQNQLQANSQVSTHAAALQLQHRAHNDRLLIEGKKRGLTYSQIAKQWLGPPPEMSTLRGRHRALTKPKNQRVRKPAWTQDDCDLLNMIVQREFDRIDNQNMHSVDLMQKLSKVAWKKVADYIRTHGGSYHFGNSTCKKKWEDLHGIKREERTKKPARKMVSN